MAKILTLQVTLIDGRFSNGPWVRVLEISDSASLEDLHVAIRCEIGFDDDHLFEFYVGRNPRNRKMEFSDPFEPFDDAENDVLLIDVYPLGDLKLYYHYDFGDDWLFEIRRKRGMMKEVDSHDINLRIVAATGDNPQQYGSGWS